jgi:sporulation protein YlmC with PRC-barrel domain
MMQATRLIGLDVRDRNGERLGDIEDVVIDARDGTLRYAVVGFGGFLGLGEKHFVYPVNALRASGRDGLTLNVPRERLEQSPGYERDRWPGNEDGNFWNEVDRFFDTDRSSAARSTQQGTRQFVRASEMLGKDINDRSGADVGEIDDIVLNLGDRKVHYVVMEFDRSWNPDDKLVALPLEAFKSFGGDELVVQRDRDSLRSAPSFERTAWPDFTDPTVRQHFGTWFSGATVAMPATMTMSRFEQLDTNGDGQLSRQEALRKPAKQ